MILYAFVMNVSVGGLFAAGILPGILVGTSLMVMTWYLSKKRGYAVAAEKATYKERGRAVKQAFLASDDARYFVRGYIIGYFYADRGGGCGGGLCVSY